MIPCQTVLDIYCLALWRTTPADGPFGNRAKRHKAFCLKTVTDRPYMSMWNSSEPMGGLSNRLIPDTLRPPNLSIQGSKSPRFRDENVNRAHFRIYLLAVKWCSEQSYSFHQKPKWVNADRAQYVWSSSGPFTIVMMTLLIWLMCCWLYLFQRWPAVLLGKISFAANWWRSVSYSIHWTCYWYKGKWPVRRVWKFCLGINWTDYSPNFSLSNFQIAVGLWWILIIQPIGGVRWNVRH